MTGEHCEWDQIRQEMADEERRSMQAATGLILVLLFCAGFTVGTVAYQWWVA